MKRCVQEGARGQDKAGKGGRHGARPYLEQGPLAVPSCLGGRSAGHRVGEA